MRPINSFVHGALSLSSFCTSLCFFSLFSVRNNKITQLFYSNFRREASLPFSQIFHFSLSSFPSVAFAVFFFFYFDLQNLDLINSEDFTAAAAAACGLLQNLDQLLPLLNNSIEEGGRYLTSLFGIDLAS